MHKNLIASSVIALFVAACSSGGSEPVTPESTAQPETTATATASASAADMPTPPATSSATAEAPKPPAPEPGADLKIVPMKVSFDAKSPTIEVKQDGSVSITKPGGKPTVVANVTKNELKSTDGSLDIAVMKDNSIQATHMNKKVGFDDKDNLVVDGGGQVAIDDKGKVDLTKPDGSKEKTAPKITGFKPEARRLATILVMMEMLTPEPAAGPATEKGATTPAPASSSKPSATPAPAGKK